MGQAEIQKILEENRGRWTPISELKLKLNQESGVIVRALNTMLYYKEVERKKFPVKRKNIEYSVFFWIIK